MDIGIGLPSTVPGTTGKQLTDWARAAEAAGFSSLGTIDRIVYPNYDPLIALSAAAAVTDRIRLATTVILGPLRVNAALLAKQLLSLDALAGGGRAVLGIGVGDRDDDFTVSGVSKADRATWMDAALATIREIWDAAGDSPIGPRPQGGGPRLIVGGGVDAALHRAARYGDGWIMGGGSPDQFAAGAGKFSAAWHQHGRDGQPATAALGYFSLGPDGEQHARQYLGDYYGHLGHDVSTMIASNAATDADAVQGHIAAFRAAGCDELILFPASADVAQVELLAAAAGL